MYDCLFYGNCNVSHNPIYVIISKIFAIKTCMTLKLTFRMTSLVKHTYANRKPICDLYLMAILKFCPSDIVCEIIANEHFKCTRIGTLEFQNNAVKYNVAGYIV